MQSRFFIHRAVVNDFEARAVAALHKGARGDGEKPRQDERRQKHVAACGEKREKSHSAASCVCMFLTSGRMIAGKSVPALK